MKTKTKPVDTPVTPAPKQEEWPNTVRTRSELDAALKEARESGESPLTFTQIIERARAKYAARD